MSIEVLIVDWQRVEAAPPDRRGELLDEAAFGEAYEAYDDDLDAAGWLRPETADADWHLKYAFARTLDSYKPHFWAGERWEAVRLFADAGLRTALDRFVSPLFWHGLEDVAGPDPESVPERECPWDVPLLLWCPPEDVAALRRHWLRAEGGLDSLREPFAEHAAVPGGWIPDFDSFARLVGGWGEVVTEAERRGWGVVGLRC
ncbi:hypothetical protein ACIBKX_14950 [Streptomyces sp. NPDC050658]|uniref:hypothetical protein n=1 Tax=unclassified Streptomyces TaxID=2593676 RepID=UPI0034279C3F